MDALPKHMITCQAGANVWYRANHTEAEYDILLLFALVVHKAVFEITQNVGRAHYNDKQGCPTAAWTMSTASRSGFEDEVKLERSPDPSIIAGHGALGNCYRQCQCSSFKDYLHC